MASTNATLSGNCGSDLNRPPKDAMADQEDAMADQAFLFHDERTALAHAPADRLFAYLDNPKSLSAHMGESSMVLLGSRMSNLWWAVGYNAIAFPLAAGVFDPFFAQPGGRSDVNVR